MTMETALPVVIDLQQTRVHAFLAHERPPPTKPPTHATNDVSDIRGARPLLKDHVYVNKPHFYEPQDVAGSSSKELHPRHRRVGVDVRYQQLHIEGSTPEPAGFKTKRVCNPLNPEYKLPSFQEAPHVAPKFLRDSYDVSDIDGTCFKNKFISNPRSPMRLDDIPGAQVGWMLSHRRALRVHPPRDILDVADIINVDFKSSRVTNVLDPVYTVNGMTYHDDALVHPKQLHRTLNKPHNALRTSDIAGASAEDAGKTVVAGIANERRRDFRPTPNRTDDVMGAHADTVLHSIRSNRRVDPNWPEYNVLDGKKVDSGAMCVAKSIVFADLVLAHDSARKRGDEPKGPYVVCGVANVGMVGGSNQSKEKEKKEKEKPPRRSTAPAVVLHGVDTGRRGSSTSSRTLATAGAAQATTSGVRVTPAEKREAEVRRKEIALVRELK